MDTMADRVEVGVQANTAYVRVHGRATFKVGPSFKQFGTMAVEQGCSRILVEMNECVGMDSTFMGILAGLSTALKKNNGEMVLHGVSDKNRTLLRMLGLLHLVRIEEGSESAALASGYALRTDEDKRHMTEAMITAHEALIEVAPDNLVKFKDVLAYLKEDLKRTAVPASGTPRSSL